MTGAARVAGAVLAAGSGRRIGTPKADLVIAGERLLDRSVRVLADAGCDPVLAVVRDGTDVPAGARAVVNPDPERGMRSSLDLAVSAAGDIPGMDALAVLLVDLPGIDVDAVRAVIEAWHRGRIAVADYAGRRGHPIVADLALWREAVGLARADEGARRLVRARPDLVDVVAVSGDPTDLDTPADLRRWTTP